jgi:hypothetical protein
VEYVGQAHRLNPTTPHAALLYPAQQHALLHLPLLGDGQVEVQDHQDDRQQQHGQAAGAEEIELAPEPAIGAARRHPGIASRLA